MAMVEAWFCVQLTIYVLIWIISDHCPAGKSNDDPILVSWQEQPYSDWKFNGVHDAMYHNKVPRAFGGKAAKQYYRQSTILNSGYDPGVLDLRGQWL